jgi:hypothetical protein
MNPHQSKEPPVTRTLAALLLVPAFALAVACGSGDKKPESASAPSSASTATAAPRPTSAAAQEPERPTTDAQEPTGDTAVGNIFSTVFGGALGGGASNRSAQQQPSDPNLGRFLPADSDLPEGFTPAGQFTYRIPDGISENGGMDMAAEMAIGGDFASSNPAGGSMLMAMVLKPDDLTALGKALGDLGSLDDATLKKSLEDAGGSFAGIIIKDVHALDASGLGEGGAGLSMTMDMSDYISKLGAGSVPAGLSVMTMHMYMFGRGDYMGAVIRIGFSDTLPGDVDELGLAKIIDRKLQAG